RFMSSFRGSQDRVGGVFDQGERIGRKTKQAPSRCDKLKALLASPMNMELAGEPKTRSGDPEPWPCRIPAVNGRASNHSARPAQRSGIVK
ncbi:MAG: hypothetical protein VYC71_05295, partial [Planctomycetota bacterium]|nr:hypothetical protein [Planctomycetota bacterium]